MARAITTRGRTTRHTRKRAASTRTSARSNRARRPTARTTNTRRKTPRTTNAPARQRVEPALQVFFDDLTTALTSGDGEAAAECFEYPGLMVMANAPKYGANQPLRDTESVADFFEQAPQMYQAKGVDETFADIQEVRPLTDDLALVRAHFPYIDADGNDMGDGETSLYVVRRVGDRFAICAAITLGTDADHAKANRGGR
jgi:hypothetical protein